MQFCYFCRVSRQLTLNKLKEQIKSQKEAECKPLPYNVIGAVKLSEAEYHSISEHLSLFHPYYESYYGKSIIDSNGIWNCIELYSERCKDAIIVYTAGQIYPLYAAVKEVAERKEL